MKAKSIKGKTPSEILKALDESKRDGFKPTLAIIILSNMEDAEELHSIFGTRDIAIFGITSPQKFSEDGITEDDILMMLLDMKPDNFKIVLNDYQGSSVYEAGYNAGISGKTAFSNPGFIIAPVNSVFSHDDLINGLTDAAAMIS